MRTIWKYEMFVADGQEIDLPRGARFLAFQEQHDMLWMWFEVDPDAPSEQRFFRIYGTGNPLDADHSSYKYRGTVQQIVRKRVFVRHLYEVTVPS